MNFCKSLWLCALLLLAQPGHADVIQTDLCVYGATSGGIAAAIQAVRMGKSVVLISTNNQIGGMTTGGLSAVDVGSSSSIGGICGEFFKRVGARYNSTGMVFAFEPHIADEEFRAMLTAANVPVRYNEKLTGVTKNGRRITEIVTDSGVIYRAKMFIDTTYEGDLMAAAGVTWTMGRESTTTYGESSAGVGQMISAFQFNSTIDPYLTPGVPSSGLLPGVQSGDGGVTGAADTKLQAYNYRLCLTSNTAKKLPITAPPDYSVANYEVLGRHLVANPNLTLNDILYFASLPNQKVDINNIGPFSTDLVGGNYDYVTATYAQRDQIATAHRNFILGLMYFLSSDSRVPSAVRTRMLAYGLANDEFMNNGNWPHQLYVREARRMVSDYVMQQGDCAGIRRAVDGVGLAAYQMDSHVVQRFVKSGKVYNEGVFYNTTPNPYPVSMRSILPRQAECENLAVPFALSASHVAFGSIRMEPVFMILSQSAATNASLAIDTDAAAQQVPYSRLSAQLRADKQELATTNIPDIIVDDADPTGVTINGAWTASTSIAGYNGTSYRIVATDTGAVDRSVRFTPVIPISGYYKVQIRWTAFNNRAVNTPYQIVHAAGTYSNTIDESNNGGVWNATNGGAPFFFNAGTDSSVLISTLGAAPGKYVVADAVRFVCVSPNLQIVASDAVAREIDPTDTGRFTVIRDASQTANPWTVNYVVSGTATPGVDYAALSGSVVIPAGETKASIVVTAIPDNLYEGPETVVVTLQPTADYIVADQSVACVKILDKPIVQITATDAIAREDNPSDTATFAITRSAADASKAWTVNYTLSGTATPGVDYQAPSGSVFLPIGETAAIVTITAIPDDLVEGAETVVLTLQPGADFVVGPLGQATAQIVELPVVGLGVSIPVAREQNPIDAAAFTLTRDPVYAGSDLTVAYQVGGTATPGLDYVALTGTVVIPSGQNSTTVFVTAIPDTLAEGTETVTITLLSNPNYRIAEPSTASVSILDQPIDDWRTTKFTPAQLAAPEISGDQADPDGDGFRNVTEYALGLDPWVAEYSAVTMGWDDHGHLTLAYRQRRSATDVTIIPEGSTTLSGWSSDPSVVSEIARIPQGDFDLVTVQLVAETPQSGFLRVRVTRP